MSELTQEDSPAGEGKKPSGNDGAAAAVGKTRRTARTSRGVSKAHKAKSTPKRMPKRSADLSKELQGKIKSVIDRRRAQPWDPTLSEVAQKLASELFGEAIAARDAGDGIGAIKLLVRSLELHSNSDQVRTELETRISQTYSTDLTKRCFIYPDPVRAESFYGEAFRKAIEFVHYNGVSGDIYEFGVLGGWTARLFAERMRDIGHLGHLHLYDSFAGLPRDKHPVDAASYDVTRGVWSDEMELPQSLRNDLGMPVEEHIACMLATIIPDERIHVSKGLFSDSLKLPVPTKAAIVHLDCDLYQSTLEVLDALDRDTALQDGTLLMFDDWNCNRGNPLFGQRRALQEFLDARNGRWSTSLFFGYGHNCTCLILHDMTLGPVTA